MTLRVAQMRSNIRNAKAVGRKLHYLLRAFFLLFVVLLLFVAFPGCTSTSKLDNVAKNNSYNSSKAFEYNTLSVNTSSIKNASDHVGTDVDKNAVNNNNNNNIVNNIVNDGNKIPKLNDSNNPYFNTTSLQSNSTNNSSSGKSIPGSAINGASVSQTNDSKGYIFIASGSRNAIFARKYVIVGLTQEWENLWKDMFPSSGSRPELPRVDFTKYDVLAIFAGSKKTGGYWLEPVGVRDDSGLVVFELNEHYPAPDCVVTQAFTQPYLVVGIPKSDKPIKVEFHLVQYKC